MSRRRMRMKRKRMWLDVKDEEENIDDEDHYWGRYY